MTSEEKKSKRLLFICHRDAVLGPMVRKLKLYFDNFDNTNIPKCRAMAYGKRVLLPVTKNKLSLMKRGILNNVECSVLRLISDVCHLRNTKIQSLCKGEGSF